MMQDQSTYVEKDSQLMIASVEMMNTSRVVPVYVIGIATFRRPTGLARTLASLAELKTELDVRIVVVDDSEGQEGAAFVKEIQGNYRWPIKIIHATERGISQARNSLVNAAFGDQHVEALLMLDDDQWVFPDWLEQMVAIQEQTGADVVGGYTVPDFDGQPAQWTDGLYVYYREKRPDGKCDMIYGTGGVLLHRSVIGLCSAPFFDPEFSKTGGSDIEFFARIKKHGASFGFASNAVAYEVIEPKRVSPSWARMRAYRIGANEVQIAALHEGRGPVAIKTAKAIAGTIAAIAKLPFVWWSSPKKHATVLMLYRNIGRLSAVIGAKYHEYK